MSQIGTKINFAPYLNTHTKKKVLYVKMAMPLEPCKSEIETHRHTLITHRHTHTHRNHTQRQGDEKTQMKKKWFNQEMLS